MKTKSNDVLYCGVSEEKIKNANPTLDLVELKIHQLYLTERHEIYKKKEIEKLPSPWTEDEVFRNYRFTNIRRELDRESKWLITHISNNDSYSLEEKILWSMLFRTWNKSETFRKLNLLEEIDIKNIDEQTIKQLRTNIESLIIKEPKYVWYTPAFNTGGLKAIWALPEQRLYECTSSNVELDVIHKETGEFHKRMTWKEAKSYIRGKKEYTIEGVEDCMPLRMIHLIKWVGSTDIAQRIMNSENQKECFQIIMEVPGFARFLAYQIFVDLTYIPEFKFSENEFVVSGPGCDAGIDMLFKDKDGMSYEECIFWLRDNLKRVWQENGLIYYPEELFDHLPEHDRCYNVMMLENSFCEHQKNSKARKGTGRPRVKYTPTSVKEENTITDLF